VNETEWHALESRTPVESIYVRGKDLRQGSRVRLIPNATGDVFDMVLRGKVATIQAVEQNYDGQILLAVVVDDDPGADMGHSLQTGHRFFFTPEEVEPLP